MTLSVINRFFVQPILFRQETNFRTKESVNCNLIAIFLVIKRFVNVCIQSVHPYFKCKKKQKTAFSSVSNKYFTEPENQQDLATTLKTGR